MSGKRVFFIISIVVLIALAGFGWYYYQGPCGVNVVKNAVESMQEQIEQFDDASTLASNAPRISLAAPIDNLQEIRRDTDDIPVPACLEPTKTLVTGGMENSIEGFLAFMGQASDDEVTSYFLDSAQQFSLATDELQRILECAPFCKEDPYRVIPQ